MPLPGSPAKGLIIADVRTGGHFLCCALSSHPQVFCVREEPFHRHSTWKRIGISQRVSLIWDQRYYDVALFRIAPLDLLQAGVAAHVLPLHVRVLYLERTNLAEQVASDVINAMHAFTPDKCKHPTHTFREGIELEPVQLSIQQVRSSCEGILSRKAGVGRMLGDRPVLRLKYEDITRAGNEVAPAEAKRICNFLNVEHHPLPTRMRKVHKRPYPETVVNWDEVRATVRDCLQRR